MPDRSPRLNVSWRQRFELASTALSAAAAIVALVWFGSQWFGSKVPILPIPSELVRLDEISWKGAANNSAVIEFSDFECPFCGVFAREHLAQIQRDILDPGLARFGFVHYPVPSTHKNAFRASESALCAGRQGKFWEMHDLLFADQKRLDENSLFERSASLGLDQVSFRACMSGPAAAQVEAQKKMAETFKVPGTPTFYVGKIQSDGRLKVTHVITGADSADRILAALRPPAPWYLLWWAVPGMLAVAIVVMLRHRRKVASAAIREEEFRKERSEP